MILVVLFTTQALLIVPCHKYIYWIVGKLFIGLIASADIKHV